MEIDQRRNKNFSTIMGKYISNVRISRQNFGWWIFGIFLLILIGGIIRAWIIPDATYFDPFMWIVNMFSGGDVGLIDHRIPDILNGLADGAALTFTISVISVIIGFFLAIILAVILVNKSHLFGLKILAQIYVDFFRSTPLLVQVLLVYFGLPRALVDLIRDLNINYLSTETFAGVLALSLNTAAYQAEIIRSGILAIPTGQAEAARSLGFSSTQTMRYVILPQAIRIIVPPLTNELINVLLNSSLISAIGVTELTKRSQSLQARYFLWQVFLMAAVFYFIIAYSMAKVAKQIENKLKIPGLGVAND